METVRDRNKVTINHLWEMVYALSNEMKIINLGWPWRSLTTSMVGYLRSSWTSCNLVIYFFSMQDLRSPSADCRKILLHGRKHVQFYNPGL